MSKSVERAASQITFEIGQIDELLAKYGDLLNRTQVCEPDIVELAAIASVLHSFYNGIENIFNSIAKLVDANAPDSAQWHRDLLIQMTERTATRGPVISTELEIRLSGYMAFRHFYRHAYSFHLDWTEMKKLVVPLRDVWTDTKTEILEFVKQLRSNQVAE